MAGKKQAERVPLGLRVTPEAKDALDLAARRSGRSQSQEAEFRLQQSFERQALIEEVLTLAYGRAVAGILMELGVVMTEAGAISAILKTGKMQDWWTDREALAKALAAGRTFFETYKPAEGKIDAR